MTTITTRSAKGSPLSFDEVDGNFNALNDGKAEVAALLQKRDINNTNFTQPVTVPPGATGSEVPQAQETEAYTDLLRSDLAASSGAGQIGFSHATPYKAGTLGAKEGQVVSITDAPYNAVADGVTDNTVAIQAAINSGALRVVVPPGEFLCGKLVMPATFGFVLQGSGTAGRLLQKAVAGALITWDQSSMHYTEGRVKDLCLVGTNGTGHLIDTTGAGGVTISGIFINDLPIGYSGIYVNGADGVYTHDIRISGLQCYSNTAGHSCVRFGGLASDSSLTDFIANGNFVVPYSLYYDIGATTIRVVDAHPYNNSVNVLRMSGNNNLCSFNSVVLDNATSDIGIASNSAYVTFTDCWFEAIQAGQTGMSVANCSGWSFVNCKFTGSVGAAAAFAEDATSNYNRVIAGNCGTIGNFVTPFVFFGAQSYSTSVNGINSLGMRYGFSGITQSQQAQATTRYFGVNGLQSSAGNTAFLVPESGYITDASVFVDSTPAAGQNFTFTVKKNGSAIGSPLVVSNGQFGGGIALNVAVAAGDQIYVESVFSATSGSANSRYTCKFTA